MPVAKRKVYEAEIRDVAAHTSDSADSDADVTVTTDELHAGGDSDLFEQYDQIRIYVVNTHDQSIDYNVEHTEPTDTDYSNTVSGTVTTVSSGGNIHTETLDTPVGRVRHSMDITGTTAPTSGHVRIVIVAF